MDACWPQQGCLWEGSMQGLRWKETGPCLVSISFPRDSLGDGSGPGHSMILEHSYQGMVQAGVTFLPVRIYLVALICSMEAHTCLGRGEVGAACWGLAGGQPEGVVSSFFFPTSSLLNYYYYYSFIIIHSSRIQHDKLILVWTEICFNS